MITIILRMKIIHQQFGRCREFKTKTKQTHGKGRESRRGSMCMHTRVAIAVRSNGLLRVSCKTVFPLVCLVLVASRRVSHTLVQLYHIGEE